MDFNQVYNGFLFSFALALLPMLAVSATSFVKLAIVFSLLRNALGVQQIPPNLVLYTFALILTGFIMAPTVSLIVDATQVADEQQLNYFEALPQVMAPLVDFLRVHVNPQQQEFFTNTAMKLWGDNAIHVPAEAEEFFILLPSFMTSEIVSAFEIGFLLYLPFLAIDLIVSNVLLSLGMMMLSPVTISLPFKLLLFVAVDGWTLLVNALVLSYV